jgi:hypothetical protein
MSGIFGTKTIRNEETQVAGFQINSATYGATVPLVLGTSRISGNVIDWYDFTAIPHTETQRTGKGGGTKVQNTTYTYTAAVLIGLAEGPAGGIGKVWADDDVYDNLAALNLTLFSGQYGQSPWANTQTKHPEKALPYSGLAYVAGVVDLGSGGGLPNLNFEYRGLLRESGDGIDVNPADAIRYIIFDELNGVGFGLGNIDAASWQRFRDFCTAADLLVTLPLTEAKKAYEIINDICKATNTTVFWSQNRLKLVPRCDERLSRNGATFEPDQAPLYDLTADDFQDSGDGALVTFEREDNAEAYNHVTVEFLNRANAYEKETAEAKVQVDINRRGLRSMPTVSLPYLHTKERAEYVAFLLVMDSLYGRNRYRFRLGWSHCLLEPGDFVTIREDSIGSDKIPVIIESIEEDVQGYLEVVAKGKPPGIYSPGRYDAHQADRPVIDYNVPPGDTTATVFDAPAELATGGLETWIAASGGEAWGECAVWASDTGDQYRAIGAVGGPSRHGVLTAALPSGASIDTANALKVKLLGGDQLLGGTQQDARNLNTLCWVDGELIAYATATLTGAKQYSLSYLVRGVYNTPITAHAAGSKFVRLDPELLKIPFSADQIGKELYLKFTSRNIYGVAEQSLAEVEAVRHTLAAQTPPNSKTLSVVEQTYTNNAGVRITGLLVTFEVPKYLHYAGTLISLSQDSGSTWRDIGTSGEGRYFIQEVEIGRTYMVRLKTKSSFGNLSSGVDSDPVTVAGFDIAPGAVSGLSYDWNAPDLRVYWNAVTTNSDGTTALDIKDYQVEVKVGSTVKRNENVAGNLYTYTYEKNIADNGQPASAVTVTVRTRDNGGKLAAAQQIACSGRTPTAPTLTVTPEIARNAIAVSVSQLNLVGFEKLEIVAKQTAGASSGGTVIYSGPSFYYAHNVGTNEKWYYQARIYSKLGLVSPWSAEVAQTTKQVEVTTMNPQILMAKTLAYANADGTGSYAVTSGALSNIHDGGATTGATFSGAGFIEDDFVGQQYFSTVRLNVAAAVQFYAQKYDDAAKAWVDCLGSAGALQAAEAGQNVFQISPIALTSKMRIYLAGGATVNELRFGTVGQADEFYFEKLTGDQIDAGTITIGNLAEGTVQQAMPLSDDVIVHFDNSLASTRGLMPKSGHDGVLVPNAGKFGGAVKVGSGISYEVGQRNPVTISVNSCKEANFTRASEAYLSDWTKVAANQPRFEKAKGALLIEGTTNLVSNGSAETDLTNWLSVFGSGSDATLTRQITDGYYGECSVECAVTNPGAYTVWCYVVSNDLTHSPKFDTTQSYTLSFMAKRVNGSGDIQVSIRDPNGLNGVMDYYSCTLTNTWQKYTFTFTPLIAGNNPTVYIKAITYPLSFRIDGLQLEQKDHATDFVNGTRADVRENLGQGLLIEERTTNFVTSPDCEAGTPKLNNSGAAASATAALSTDHAHSGTKSLKITTSTTSGTIDRFYQVGSLNSLNSLSAGSTYTFSAWVYVPSSSGITLSNVFLRAYYYTGSSYPGVTSSTMTAYDTWQRLSVTFTVPSTATAIFFRVYIRQDSTSVSIYADDLQVENRPYATSFTPATRSDEIVIVPMDGMSPSRGTIEITANVTSQFHTAANPRWTMILSTGKLPGGTSLEVNQISFRRSPNSTRWSCMVSNSAGTTYTIPFANAIPDGMHRFKFCWDETGGKAYLDNVLTGTCDASYLPNQFVSGLYVGNWMGSSLQLNSTVSDLRLSNIARTDAPDLTKPLSVDEHTVGYYPLQNSLIGGMIHYAIVDNALKYIQGVRDDNLDLSFVSYTNGVVSLTGNRYFDELYVTNRVATADEIKSWASQGPFYDASPVVTDDQISSAALTNFNSRNDRKSTVPAAPVLPTDGTCLDHAVNTDGSVNLSIEWTYAGSGDAYDIDGFEVLVRAGSTSAAYTFGTSPLEEQVYVVPADKRALIVYGIPANSYYTVGVRAYRMVDQDINVSGVLRSAITKASGSGENPYQPSAAVAFAGNITGTISGTPATTIVTNANNGNAAWNGTVQYRSTGTPTNNPVPAGITVTQNANGSMNIRLDWSAYSQGVKRADLLLLFWRRGTASGLGAPILTDTAISFNVNDTAASYYIFEGVAPGWYSFGLAAARKTEFGLEVGGIVSPTSPKWQDVNATAASYNAGTVPITSGGGSVKIDSAGLRTYNGATLQCSVGTDGELTASGGAVKMGASGFRAYTGTTETFRADANGIVLGSSDGKTKFTGTAWEIRDENGVLRVRIGKLD